ncbi:hypothetical protein V8D89_002104 [Ganoderma adspersum]
MRTTYKPLPAMSHNDAQSSAPALAVLQEITQSSDMPASYVCDFGSTLTLKSALSLKKDLSRMSGDGAKRAFPSRQFAAKMAFFHVFNRDLGNTYRLRRKQVTVTTTRGYAVKQQPSKARLAYLVAREMEKYLRECNLRQQPFPYTLDDIVLRRIDLESRGTLRPRLFVYVRGPCSIRSTSAATC